MSIEMCMREDSPFFRMGAEVRETGIRVGREGLMMGEDK